MDEHAVVIGQARELLVAYQQSRDLDQLREAVAAHRQADRSVPRDHPQRPALVNNFGYALSQLRTATGEDAGVEEEVWAYQSAADALSAASPSGRQALYNLASAVFALYMKTRDDRLLAKHVSVRRELLAATPADDQSYAGHRYLLGRALMALRRLGETLDCLEEEVAVQRAVVAATPAGDGGRAELLGEFLDALWQRYNQNQDSALLTEGAAVYRELAAAPEAEPQLDRWAKVIDYLLADFRDVTGDSSLLGDEVRAERAIVAAARAGQPGLDLGGALIVLGEGLSAQAELAPEAEATGLYEEAVAVSREAVAVTGPHDTRLPSRNARLGWSLWWLALRRDGPRQLELLTEAAGCYRSALAGAADGDRARADYADYLAQLMDVLSRQTHDGSLLSEEVAALRIALAAAEADDPRRPGLLARLGMGLGALWPAADDHGMRAEAVQVLRDAAAVLPDDDELRVPVLCELGIFMLAAQAGTEVDDATLAAALGILKQAVAAATPDHPLRATALYWLSLAYQSQFERHDDQQALAEAIAAAREATDRSTPDDLDRATYLGQLGDLLTLSSDRSRDGAGTAESVAAARRALAAVAADDRGRAERLNTLGVALLTHFRGSGDADALAESVTALREAAIAPDAEPRTLVVLSLALRASYGRTGEPALLDEALAVTADAISRCPQGHDDRGGALGAFAACQLEYYERTRELSALTTSIESLRAALVIAPSPRQRGEDLMNLSTALRTRYQRVGDMTALSEAAGTAREAVALLAPDDPLHSNALKNLADALLFTYQRTMNMELLRAAVATYRAALGELPATDPARFMVQHNLSIVLARTGIMDREPETIREAVSLGRQALAALSARDPRRLLCQNGISGALRDLAELTGDKSPARAAVKVQRDVVAATPEENPEKSQFLFTLGTALRQLHTLTGRKRLLAEAEDSFLRSGRHAPGALMWRVLGSCEAAATALLRPDGAVDALAAAESAVALLSDLDLSSLIVADQQFRMGQLSSVPGQVAAAAIAAGRLDRAVELLELTRGVGLRSITGAAGGTALSASALTAVADRGPVVLVNVSPSRCDALILTADPGDPVRLVPLPGLTEAEVTANVDRLARIYGHYADAHPDDPEETIGGILGWLWDTTAEPVLDALGYLDVAPGDRERPRASADLPRVWWCPIGPLALLPLQAAGHVEDLASADPQIAANPRTVLDRVVSSLVTTVTSLARARAQSRQAPVEAVVIAVPNAPGSSPLSYVLREAAAIRALIPTARLLTDATRDDVVAALTGHGIAHFACHAYPDLANPATGYLGLADQQSVKLTVADIAALQLGGGLAYLSACDTTFTLRPFANEAVHITGAFHVAGYGQVIGALWPVDDRAAAEIARGFYRSLTAVGTQRPALDLAPYALHDAIQAARARYPAQPGLWSAHLHTGG